ncbi:MAG: glycosyltransferase [Leptolyngbya sp. SIO3F4]|nr:glycosyltransferase [Leptolyngbya sp. SIO3F4]
MTLPRVTVLIRAKNEATFIGQTLDLINKQSLTPHEVIVVDSGSTDGTIEIVQGWKTVRLIHMPSEQFTFGRSLNWGFEAATGEIIVSISAHAFPSDSDWLANLAKHFENPKVAGVYGQQIPQPDAWPPVRRNYEGYYGGKRNVQIDANRESDRTFSNANSAVRKSCWEHRPFDEALTAAEDHEWAWAMLKLGYFIVYEPEAGAYHSHNESLAKLSHRSYRETLASNQLYQREMSLYRGIYSWYRWVVADIQFILKHQLDLVWIVQVPFYRAAEAYGCLRASSPTALLNLQPKRLSQRVHGSTS